jgi:hypothetical protein
VRIGAHPAAMRKRSKCYASSLNSLTLVFHDHFRNCDENRHMSVHVAASSAADAQCSWLHTDSRDTRGFEPEQFRCMLQQHACAVTAVLSLQHIGSRCHITHPPSILDITCNRTELLKQTIQRCFVATGVVSAHHMPSLSPWQNLACSVTHCSTPSACVP